MWIPVASDCTVTAPIYFLPRSLGLVDFLALLGAVWGGMVGRMAAAAYMRVAAVTASATGRLVEI